MNVTQVSFHKFGDYFPGTGSIEDIGYDKGKLYSLNVPLQDGIDDENYEQLFKPIMTKVMERYAQHCSLLSALSPPHTLLLRDVSGATRKFPMVEMK